MTSPACRAVEPCTSTSFTVAPPRPTRSWSRSNWTTSAPEGSLVLPCPSRSGYELSVSITKSSQRFVGKATGEVGGGRRRGTILDRTGTRLTWLPKDCSRESCLARGPRHPPESGENTLRLAPGPQHLRTPFVAQTTANVADHWLPRESSNGVEAPRTPSLQGRETNSSVQGPPRDGKHARSPEPFHPGACDVAAKVAPGTLLVDEWPIGCTPAQRRPRRRGLGSC